MHPDEVVDRLFEEARTGDSRHTDVLYHPLTEFQVGPALELGQGEEIRNVYHDKISTLWDVVLEADGIQPGKEVVALLGVKSAQTFIVACGHGQTGDGGLLQGCGCTDSQEIMHLAGALDDVGRADEVAQTPAGDGVGLGEGVAGDGVLEHTGQAGHADVLCRGVDDVLIHLIRHHKSVVLDGKPGDGFQLVAAEDLAAGVGGVAEDKRLGTLGKALLDEAQIELILRRHQRDVDGFSPREDGVCAVVLVKRREDHHLVAGVADGHHGGHHGLGAAAGDADFRVGVHLVVEGRAGLFRQRLPEVLRTEGHSVLMGAVVGGFGQRVGQLLRRVKIREALRQVDGIVLVVDAGHPADDGVGKGADAVA